MNKLKRNPKKKKKIIEIKLSESDSEDIEVTDDSGSEDFEDAIQKNQLQQKKVLIWY